MSVLTRTEIEVVQDLSDGFDTPQIALRRHRHQETIRKHVKNAREKLGAKTYGHLIKLAMMQGLIQSVLLFVVSLNALSISSVSLEDDERPHDDFRRPRFTRSFSARGRRVREDEV